MWRGLKARVKRFEDMISKKILKIIIPTLLTDIRTHNLYVGVYIIPILVSIFNEKNTTLSNSK